MKQLFAFLVLALLVFGCAGYGSQQPPASNPQPPVKNQGTTATVEISGFAFSPASLEISAGTTVTWKNKDAVPHTATGNNGEFDTGTISSGGEASHTFSTPGTYAYHCSVHPAMKATIVVK